MTHEVGKKPLYYAKDGVVWKRPISEKTPSGERITIGFPVCEIHDAAGADAADAVAQLMNLGEAAQSGTEADLRKQIANLGAEVAKLTARLGARAAPSEIAELRAKLGGVSSHRLEEDNLAIFLVSQFQRYVASDTETDDNGWPLEALSIMDEVLDAIHAHYAPALLTAGERAIELEAENKKLRELLTPFRRVPSSIYELRVAAQTVQAELGVVIPSRTAPPALSETKARDENANGGPTP